MSASVVNQRYTLNDLTNKSAQIGNLGSETDIYVDRQRSGWATLGWLIIAALIVGLILWLLNPQFIQSFNPSTGLMSLDWGKLILWSIIIALIIGLIWWAFTGNRKVIHVDQV